MCIIKMHTARELEVKVYSNSCLVFEETVCSNFINMLFKSSKTNSSGGGQRTLNLVLLRSQLLFLIGFNLLL